MTAARSLSAIHRDELDQTLLGDPFAYAKETGREALEDEFRAFADGLRDAPDGPVRAELAVERPCPLCRKTLGELRFEKYGFTVRHCRSCLFEFSTPMLDETKVVHGNIDDEALSLAHLRFIEKPAYAAVAKLRFEYEIQQLLSAWDKDRPPKTFLEIGCSTGTGLDIAKHYGLEVLGLEPNKEAVLVARERGLTVIEDRLRDGVLEPNSIDLMMTLDVLEHIPDPVEFLQVAEKILVPGGLILIQVPNAGSLMTWLNGRDDQIYNGLIHLNYFDGKSLDRTAELAGLSVVESTSFLSELGKLQQYSAVQIKAALLERAPHLLDKFRLHQDFINDHRLGYKLLGIYQKEA